VKPHLGLLRLLGGGGLGFAIPLGIALTASLPAYAAATVVTDVQVIETDGGMELVLETSDGERPQVFTVSRGNTLVADLVNTQLRLDEGNGFLQNNPAPGISAVMVSQLDANSVRVSITGETSAPVSEVSQGDNGIVFNVGNGSAIAESDEAITFEQPSQGTELSQLPDEPEPVDPFFEGDEDVLIPDPNVVIDGIPVTPSQVSAPVRPRAIAPPVGDIAVATTDITPEPINLGTDEIVPRLVLRDAPVRDVLSLLGRAAGINVAFLTAGETEGQAGAEPGAAEPRISLDIENESVQNVFNYVLRISGLQASLDGRTVFVGRSLPNDSRNLLMRTVRLNQVDVTSALNFLVALGAETAVSRERLITSVNAVSVAEAAEGSPSLTQTQTTTEERIEVQRVEYTDSVPILRGLQVTGDERTNTLTLTGPGRLIDIASSQLVNLDIRRRQVAVNVRVIDVNLLNTDNVNTSFSFGLGLTDFIVNGGVGVINFGERTPVTVNGLGANNLDIPDNFLARLQASIQSGNAKILTDPTLVVQEGQTAQVQLTQDVITNFERTVDATEDDSTVTVTVETEPAGLILEIAVDQIDDNGFISLSVAPSISAIAGTEEVEFDDDEFVITLLSERRLTSGLIRVRDGQTLILSGIIRDEDRATVTKVPILGDIPILGALFRSTERENVRQELIVILTPQILDDSDQSVFGYRYTPGPEAQELMNR